jgi:hypothetical protein
VCESNAPATPEAPPAGFISGHSELKSSAAEVFVLAFVPVELFLEIGLGVLDSRECAQWSRELLAAHGAGSDTRHRTQLLNYSDDTFRHESSLRAGFVHAPLTLRPVLFCTTPARGTALAAPAGLV